MGEAVIHRQERQKGPKAGAHRAQTHRVSAGRDMEVFDDFVIGLHRWWRSTPEIINNPLRSRLDSERAKLGNTASENERGQKNHKKSARSFRPCSCLPLAPKFPSTKKQLKFHLQCYDLQCFSFARIQSARRGLF